MYNISRLRVKTDREEIGCEAVEWRQWLKLEVLWWAVQNTAMNLYIPQYEYTMEMSVTCNIIAVSTTYWQNKQQMNAIPMWQQLPHS